MTTDTADGIGIPRIVITTGPLPVADGRPPLAVGETVLLLARIDAEILCCAPEGRIFKVGVTDLSRRFRSVEVGSAGDESHARGLAVLAALLTIGCGALHAAESEGDGTIRSYGDALWYGINTISTVGVADVTPETPLGKIIASALMVAGNPLYARVGSDLSAKLLGSGGGRRECSELADRLGRLTEAL